MSAGKLKAMNSDAQPNRQLVARLAQRNREIVHFLFTLPGLLLYSIFFLGPVSIGIYYSLTDWSGLTPKYNFIGLKNYLATFRDARFLSDIKFTLSYTVILTVSVTLISLLLALVLNMKLHMKTFFRSVYFFPAVLGSIVVGLIWNQIFYGAIPEIGNWLGVDVLSSNILANPKLVMYGIVFVNVWQGAAIPMVLFIAGLQSVPQYLHEAGKLDGASAFQRFRKITVPFLIPVLSIVLILNIKSGLTTFEYIMAMTGGGPGFSTESIGVLIYKQGFGNNRFAYGAAQSVILLISIAILAIIQFSFLHRKGVEQQ